MRVISEADLLLVSGGQSGYAASSGLSAQNNNPLGQSMRTFATTKMALAGMVGSVGMAGIAGAVGTLVVDAALAEAGVP